MELWIHCFCTRRRPFRSSDCYFWRFSTQSLFSCRSISLLRPRKIINVQIWLMAVWNLDQPWVLEMQCTSVPLEVKQNHMAVLKGLVHQFVKQIFSGYLYWLSHVLFFLYSAGWSHAAFGAGIQIWDIFTHRHPNNSENNCKCSWNMNMFKDTVKDAVFADIRPTFGPEGQYISGVCTYWLLKIQRIITAELGFPLLFFRMSQGWTVWATGKPWESGGGRHLPPFPFAANPPREFVHSDFS